MKLLVLSDSHSTLSFMRNCVDTIKPDGIIHLGDHYDDGQVLQEEYPYIRVWQVPGNCDRYRVPSHIPEILITRIAGVDFYLTHGHKHGVKMDLKLLLRDARASGTAAVLYGHTHIADCHQEEDGLWVLNPGASTYGGGTAGLIDIQDEKITSCRLLRRGGWEVRK